MAFRQTLLRFGMALCLVFVQVFSARQGYITDNPLLLGYGIAVTVYGFLFWGRATAHLHKAKEQKTLSIIGLYRYLRHPVYVGMYVILAGVGIVFFSWAWFIMLGAFIPLWLLECRREEQNLLEVYGERYQAYKEKTWF